MFLLCVDPGHGGKDPGAIGIGGKTEADVNLEIALLVGRIAESRGLSVLLTRTDDRFISLSARSSASNLVKASCFVSIHCNGSANDSAHGIEVITSLGDTSADPLATNVIAHLGSTFPDEKIRVDFSDNDPDKEMNLYVLRHTDSPAILVECGFITHPESEEKLIDPSYQMLMALAIVDGVMEWKRTWY